MRTHWLIYFVFFVMVILLGACGNEMQSTAPIFVVIAPSPTPIIALKVNGTPILKDTLDLARRTYPATTETATEAIIESHLINRVLMAESAKDIAIADNTVAERMAALKGTVSPEVYSTWLAKNNLSPELLQQTIRAEVTAEALFDTVTHAVPATAKQIHARCLQIPAEIGATAIYQQLSDGEVFSTFATRYGCTDTAQHYGGDLGWFPQGISLLPAEVESEAFSLPANTLKLIPTETGAYIIRVEAVDEDRPLTPEYHYQVRVKAFEQWLAQQRAAAVVERIAN